MLVEFSWSCQKKGNGMKDGAKFCRCRYALLSGIASTRVGRGDPMHHT